MVFGCSGAGRLATADVRGFPDLQQLIAEMAAANRTWGEERIASELRLKLGIIVSPRTVRRYMRRPPPPDRRSRSQSWRTFVRNHAHELLACDFFISVTATFRIVYIFVSWMSARAALCTGTPPNIQRANGPFSSSVRV